MQKNAEDAVAAHMAKLQAEFFVQNTPERNPTTPFLDLDDGQIEGIMNRAMKSSARWRALKRQGKSEKEIRDSFNKKTGMTVLTGTAILTKRHSNDPIGFHSLLQNLFTYGHDVHGATNRPY